MRQSIDAGVIYRQLAPGRAFTSADDVKATLDLIKWYDYAIAKSDAIIGQMCMTFPLDDDKKADFFRFFSWSDEKGENNFAMEFIRVLWQAQLRTEHFRRRRPQKGRISIDLIDVKKIIRESFRLTRHSLGQVYWQPKIELISVNRQHSNAIWRLHFRPVIIASFLIPHTPAHHTSIRWITQFISITRSRHLACQPALNNSRNIASPKTGDEGWCANMLRTIARKQIGVYKTFSKLK